MQFVELFTIRGCEADHPCRISVVIARPGLLGLAESCVFDEVLGGIQWQQLVFFESEV